MTDLQRLASGHRTEVVSGSIEIIYRLPDENRVTRRLSIMCEKSYDGETLWSHMMVDSTDRPFANICTGSQQKCSFKERNLGKWNNTDNKK